MLRPHNARTEREKRARLLGCVCLESEQDTCSSRRRQGRCWGVELRVTVGGVGVGQKIWWPEVATAGLGTSARGSSKQTGGALPTYNFRPEPLCRLRQQRQSCGGGSPALSCFCDAPCGESEPALPSFYLPPRQSAHALCAFLLAAPLRTVPKYWYMVHPGPARCEKATVSPPFTKTAKHLRHHQPANRQHAIPTRNPHTHPLRPP